MKEKLGVFFLVIGIACAIGFFFALGFGLLFLISTIEYTSFVEYWVSVIIVGFMGIAVIAIMTAYCINFIPDEWGYKKQLIESDDKTLTGKVSHLAYTIHSPLADYFNNPPTPSGFLNLLYTTETNPMRPTHTVALEILEITKRDLPDEEKLKLIASIIQDYSEDVVSDKIPY